MSNGRLRLLLVGLLAGLIWLGLYHPPGLAAPLAQDPAPLSLKGRLEPRHFVTLASPLPGRIAQVRAVEGQEVQAGEIVVVIEGSEALAAEVAAAELQVTLASQALDELYRAAASERAQTGVELARIQREYALEEDFYESMARGEPEMYVQQARNNLRLLEQQLEQARTDLSFYQKRFTNPDSLLRRFVNDRAFRLRIADLEGRVAELEQRQIDAQEKLDEMLAGPDELDLRVAETKMRLARQRFDRIAQEYADLLKGPNPHKLETAQASLAAAQARLAAAQQSAAGLTIEAPISGHVVQVQAKAGQWTAPGAALVTIADQSGWSVELPEIEESEVVQLAEGMCSRVTPDAYPEIVLSGELVSIARYFSLEAEQVVYSAQIDCDCADPRLRWGLTVRVEFDSDCR